ncbi:MAG: hypothetical protein GY868_04970 [Deltaproteobacteria bacterium]|nr:hypothetical protein [Deltaproteobacteria bacterium]
MSRVDFKDMVKFVEEVEKSGLLSGLDLEPIESYQGMDTGVARNIKTPMAMADYQAFRIKGSDKVDKIAYGELHYMKRAKYCSMNFTCGDDYDLPVYACEYDETAKRLSITVDLMPLVDVGAHPEYRKKYLDPLGGHWRKARVLEGLSVDGRCLVQRRYGPWPWARASMSPYPIDGRLSNTDDRMNVLEAVFGYARTWLELLEQAQPMPEGDYKEEVLKRKRVMQTYYRELDPGGEVLKKVVGNEREKVIVSLIF